MQNTLQGSSGAEKPILQDVSSATATPLWNELVLNAEELRGQWVHPPDSPQTETDLMHICRAMLRRSSLNMTQVFLAHRTGLSQTSLSLYLRGLYRGNQTSLEERLLSFIRDVTSGDNKNILSALEDKRANPGPRVALGRSSMSLDAQPPATSMPLSATPQASNYNGTFPFLSHSVSNAANQTSSGPLIQVPATQHTTAPLHDKQPPPTGCQADSKFHATALPSSGAQTKPFPSQITGNHVASAASLPNGNMAHPTGDQSLYPHMATSHHPPQSAVPSANGHVIPAVSYSTGPYQISNGPWTGGAHNIATSTGLSSTLHQSDPSTAPIQPVMHTETLPASQNQHYVQNVPYNVSQASTAISTGINNAPPVTSVAEQTPAFPVPPIDISQQPYQSLSQPSQQTLQQASFMTRGGNPQSVDTASQRPPNVAIQYHAQGPNQLQHRQTVLPASQTQSETWNQSIQHRPPSQNAVQRSDMGVQRGNLTTRFENNQANINSSSASHARLPHREAGATVSGPRTILPRQPEIIPQTHQFPLHSLSANAPMRSTAELPSRSQQLFNNNPPNVNTSTTTQWNQMSVVNSATPKFAPPAASQLSMQTFNSGINQVAVSQIAPLTDHGVSYFPGTSRTAQTATGQTFPAAGRSRDGTESKSDAQERFQKQYLEQLQMQQVQSMQQAQQIQLIQQQYQMQQAQRQLQLQLGHQQSQANGALTSGHGSAAAASGGNALYSNSSQLLSTVQTAGHDSFPSSDAALPVAPNQLNVQRSEQNMSQQKRPRPSYGAPVIEQLDSISATMAVDRAFHVFSLSKWLGQCEKGESLLLPIEIFVEKDGVVFHHFTQWDVNEKCTSPEAVAGRIVNLRKVPAFFEPLVAALIRRRLFEAGVIPPPPPTSSRPAENLFTIKVHVELEENDQTQVIDESLEWDVGSGLLNSPELLAQSLCADIGVSQKHVATVARAIRREVSKANAIAYGDEETKALALGQSSSTTNALVVRDASSTKANPSRTDQASVDNGADRSNEENSPDHSPCDERPGRDPETAQSRFDNEAASLEEMNDGVDRTDDVHRDVELAKRRASAEEHALRKHGIDVSPYTQMSLGRRSHPSVWIEGILERRKHGESLLPAISTQSIRVSEASKLEPDVQIDVAGIKEMPVEKRFEGATEFSVGQNSVRKVRLRVNGIRSSLSGTESSNSRKRYRPSAPEDASDDDNEIASPLISDGSMEGTVLRLRIRPPRKIPRRAANLMLRLPLAASISSSRRLKNQVARDKS